jgi:transcriptional regulator with XRE-family HTH domain
VSSRISPLDDAARRAEQFKANASEELRNARLARGLSQAAIARGLSITRSQVSRIERNRIRSLNLDALARHAAMVGLRPSLKLYPVGGGLRDAAQARYIARFVERVGRGWRVRLDVPIALPGDLRAVDVLLEGACVIAVEVVTRLLDLQAVLRAAQLKQRDIGAARLIIVVAGTHANRRALAEARPTLIATFDLDTQRTLAELAAGRDPGRDAIVVLAA